MMRDETIISMAPRRNIVIEPRRAGDLDPRYSGFRRLVVVVILIGAASRALPLFDFGGRVLRQFPTEDAYLMLTVARNVALGHGMTTAAGTTATNGVQPLIAYLWSFAFRVVGGDRWSGVLLVSVSEFIIAAVAAWLLYVFGRRVLAGVAGGTRMAVLAASAWYANIVAVRHTMNAQESAAYAVAVLLVVLVYGRSRERGSSTWTNLRCIGFGVLLGLVFWIRVDAVFLIAAACVTHLFVADDGGVRLDRRRSTESVLVGISATVVAAPWLVYGWTHFGSIVPISGTAQSWFAEPAGSLAYVIVALAEYVLVVLPIPQSVEQLLPVVVSCAVLLIAAIGALVCIWLRTTGRVRLAVTFAGLYAFGVATYYGFFFGAPYFASRYMFPVSPFLALLWAWVVVELWRRVPLRARVAMAIAFVGVVLYPNVRLYLRGKHHPHFQVVEWVDLNVADDVWVGAPQSGTLGFFHDRTINLDGKVNPQALAARRAGGLRLIEYILSQPIRYIVDWRTIGVWMESSEVARHFELVVDDRERNLAVLRRTD